MSARKRDGHARRGHSHAASDERSQEDGLGYLRARPPHPQPPLNERKYAPRVLCVDSMMIWACFKNENNTAYSENMLHVCCVLTR